MVLAFELSLLLKEFPELIHNIVLILYGCYIGMIKGNDLKKVIIIRLIILSNCSPSESNAMKSG